MSHRPVFFLFIILAFAAGTLAYWASPKFKLRGIPCTDGYTLAMKHSDPDQHGLPQQLSLALEKDGAVSRHELIPTPVASGSKFATADGSLTVWEHQGEYEVRMGDTKVLTCQPPPRR
jgi:hypothetical protein